MDKMTAINRKRDRGSTMVETAIVLLLLLLLTLGTVQYGWLLLNCQQITNAARQGARIAILSRPTAEAEARSRIDSLLDAIGLSDNSPTVTITYTPIPGDPDGRTDVTVVISVPTTNLVLINADWLPTPETLGARVTMVQEG